MRKLAAADLALAEGFHAEPYPKIEVVSANGNTRLSRADKNLIALVKDDPKEAKRFPLLLPKVSSRWQISLRLKLYREAATDFSLGFRS